jgi:hypothetical protein
MSTVFCSVPTPSVGTVYIGGFFGCAVGTWRAVVGLFGWVRYCISLSYFIVVCTISKPQNFHEVVIIWLESGATNLHSHQVVKVGQARLGWLLRDMHGIYMLLPAGLDFSRFAHLERDLYGLYGLGRRSRGTRCSKTTCFGPKLHVTVSP